MAVSKPGRVRGRRELYVHILHNLLTRRSRKEALSLRHNRDLKRSQHPLILRSRKMISGGPRRFSAVIPNDRKRCILKSLKARNKHIRDFEKAFATLVILIVAAQHSTCDQFAQGSTGEIYGLVVGLEGLLAEELHAID